MPGTCNCCTDKNIDIIDLMLPYHTNVDNNLSNRQNNFYLNVIDLLLFEWHIKLCPVKSYLKYIPKEGLQLILITTVKSKQSYHTDTKFILYNRTSKTHSK